VSGSLKDQLISLGLAKEPPPKRKPGRRKTLQDRRDQGDISLREAFRRKARSEQQDAESKRQAKRAEQLERQRINGRIQPIVDLHKQNDPAAELKRNFLYKGRIRTVLATPEQLRALNAGELGLVFLRGSYFIVAREIVDQVRAISEDHVPELSGGTEDAEEEHPVPDDLVW